jgi:hypothetical protein
MVAICRDWERVIGLLGGRQAGGWRHLPEDRQRSDWRRTGWTREKNILRVIEWEPERHRRGT